MILLPQMQYAAGPVTWADELELQLDVLYVSVVCLRALAVKC
jgi:hypothetical protein